MSIAIAKYNLWNKYEDSHDTICFRIGYCWHQSLFYVIVFICIGTLFTGGVMFQS